MTRAQSWLRITRPRRTALYPQVSRPRYWRQSGHWWPPAPPFFHLPKEPSELLSGLQRKLPLIGSPGERPIEGTATSSPSMQATLVYQSPRRAAAARQGANRLMGHLRSWGYCRRAVRRTPCGQRPRGAAAMDLASPTCPRGRAPRKKCKLSYRHRLMIVSMMRAGLTWDRIRREMPVSVSNSAIRRTLHGRAVYIGVLQIENVDLEAVRYRPPAHPML